MLSGMPSWSEAAGGVWRFYIDEMIRFADRALEPECTPLMQVYRACKTVVSRNMASVSRQQ